mmetsp:Transcript_43468/g.92514  ORF Transcript_43468/g.92514 Transcript_43468/m.92514 type:complete len:266 (+) Transcript_43468:802-1599(+)
MHLHGHGLLHRARVRPARDDMRDGGGGGPRKVARGAERLGQSPVEAALRLVGVLEEAAGENKLNALQDMAAVRLQSGSGRGLGPRRPVQVDLTEHPQHIHKHCVGPPVLFGKGAAAVIKAAERVHLEHSVSGAGVPRVLPVVDNHQRSCSIVVTFLQLDVSERLVEYFCLPVLSAEDLVVEDVQPWVDRVQHMPGVRLGSHRIYVQLRECLQLVKEGVEGIAGPHEVARFASGGSREEEGVYAARRMADVLALRLDRVQQRVVQV